MSIFKKSQLGIRSYGSGSGHIVLNHPNFQFVSFFNSKKFVPPCSRDLNPNLF